MRRSKYSGCCRTGSTISRLRRALLEPLSRTTSTTASACTRCGAPPLEKGAIEPWPPITDATVLDAAPFPPAMLH